VVAKPGAGFSVRKVLTKEVGQSGPILGSVGRRGYLDGLTTRELEYEDVAYVSPPIQVAPKQAVGWPEKKLKLNMVVVETKIFRDEHKPNSYRHYYDRDQQSQAILK
jgi:hypothetical protein